MDNFTDQPILTFKQQNIIDGAVSFVHDGSDLPPCLQRDCQQWKNHRRSASQPD